MNRPAGSVTLTHGFRVSVAPSFLDEHSDPESSKWVFAYRIRIGNESDSAARVVSRYWRIIDGHGEQHEVEGEGVVGQQPRIEPGHSFVYESFCPLATPWGTMEGHYVMEPDAGERFRIDIGRFFLVSTPQKQSQGESSSDA